MKYIQDLFSNYNPEGNTPSISGNGSSTSIIQSSFLDKDSSLKDSLQMPISSNITSNDYRELDSTTSLSDAELQLSDLEYTASKDSNMSNHDFGNHLYQKFTVNEEFMMEILFLCESIGTTLTFIDMLVTTICKFARKPEMNFNSIPSRKKLQSKLIHFSILECPIMKSISGITFPKFHFLSQLKDLLDSQIAKDPKNLCFNGYRKYEPLSNKQFQEVLSSNWYSRTWDKQVLDDKTFLIPIVFYVDKTGTDLLQCYPLEPLMFSMCIFTNKTLQNASAWRHLGFLPLSHPQLTSKSTSKKKKNTSHILSKENSNNSKHKKTESSIQFYHQCLFELLEDFKNLQTNPPEISLSLGGVAKTCHVLFPVSFIVGDKLSQNGLCL